MGADKVKVLHGFALEGCWKEIAGERPEKRLTKKGKVVHGKNNSVINNPQPWEFTDYPEAKVGEMIRRHKKR